MSQETFCVNPWVSLHAKMSDGFNPCCLFSTSINTKTVDEYVNSPELASVKQRLLNGEKISECSNCWVQESNGYVSKRQRDNKTYEKQFQELNTDLTATHGNFVEYYVRLGNHCNLRCTTCNANASSGWISELKKFNIDTKPIKLLPDNHDVWDHIKNHAQSINAIEFIGGEPFMMSVNEQESLLEWLVDQGHANHIKLKYNTNGTRLPTGLLKFWEKFKTIELNISADGIGPRFNYLRFPAEWTEVDANIKYYQSLQETIPGLEITIIFTFSVLNIGYVEEMLDYCRNNNLNIFLNMLIQPNVLNVFNACKELKDWFADTLKDVDHPVIKNLLTNLNNTSSTVTAQQLVDFLITLDQRRNLDVRRTFPEFAQCLQSATFLPIV